MKNTILKSAIGLALCAIIAQSHANDSVGYVAIGGVEYIKNDKISMHSEDLYISDDMIKVDYEFKNLSNQDITETVLFPLPIVPVLADYEYDFADTKETFESFKTWVNGKAVKPTIHARAFVYPKKDGRTDYDAKPIDVTQKFKQCGLTDGEIMHGWTKQGNLANINQKLANCHDSELKKLIGEYKPSDNSDDIYDGLEYAFNWQSQVIYSWQQTFKANTITRIKHEYEPLVGGSVHLSESQYPYYCVDNKTQRALQKSKYGNPYSGVGYILTTGANWAKPISNFKLTIERDDDEVVSFCWAGKGKVQNLGRGKFQIIEKNFTPKKDLDIVFIKVK